MTVSNAVVCEWYTRSNDPFIAVTAGTAGNGNGNVTISVTANTGAARTGSVTIGDDADDLVFRVKQHLTKLWPWRDTAALAPRVAGHG